MWLEATRRLPRVVVVEREVVVEERMREDTQRSRKGQHELRTALSQQEHLLPCGIEAWGMEARNQEVRDAVHCASMGKRKPRNTSAGTSAIGLWTKNSKDMK